MIPTTTNNVNARLQKASYRLPDHVSVYQSELTVVGEACNNLHFDVNRPITLLLGLTVLFIHLPSNEIPFEAKQLQTALHHQSDFHSQRWRDAMDRTLGKRRGR